MLVSSFFVFLLLFSTELPAKKLQKLRNITDTLPPGSWIEIPDSKIPLISRNKVAEIENKQDGGSIWGVQGSKSVIKAWNGAAFDGERWWFFGGGHNAYGGNEVYQFDFNSLTWDMLVPPSPLIHPEKVKNKLCYMPKSGPIALHTYDSFTWNPVSASIWLLRSDGIAYCEKSYFKKKNLPFWEFNPETKEWISHDSQGIITGRPMSAWNPISKRIVLFPKSNHKKSRGPLEVDEKGAIFRRGNKKLGVVTGSLVYNPVNQTMYATSKKAIKQLLLKGDKSGNLVTVAKFPQEMIEDGVREGGMAFAKDINSLVFWTGQRHVWTWNVDTKKFHLIVNDSSATAPNGHNLIFSKWIYLPEISAFAGLNTPEHGVWIYKFGGPSKILEPNKPRACINKQCTYTSIAKACSSAKDGDVIKILTGDWKEGCVIRASNITIMGEVQAAFTKAMNGKAALIIKGNNTIVKNLECHSIKVPHGNGACVRLEGKNLTLKNVYFHHNQQGILTGKKSGTITIENSRIEYNGQDSHPTGRSHGLYINGDTLKVINSKIIGTSNEGHEVKSRTRKTIIENSIIASENSNDSRLIDIANGGSLTIRNSLLQHGKQSKNHQLIGFGWERGKRGPTWEENSIFLEDNTIVIDAKNHKLFGIKDNFITPRLKNNIIIGNDINFSGNCHFNNRSSAGLPAYPDFKLTKKSCK